MHYFGAVTLKGVHPDGTMEKKMRKKGAITPR
jgi:hypothetical protein